MEQILKTVQEIGNGGHIYLPKETVGKKVLITLVEKSIEDIERDIIYTLKPYLKHISGIYLCGSYARKEQTLESDIDILVVTDGKVNINKKINDYEIISASVEQIEKTIENNAVLILPILRETKPILNQEAINKYKNQKLTKKNTKWYIETTESSLNLVKHLIEQKDDLPYIAYPLILRLRGLYMIDLLIQNKGYYNKDLIKLIVKNGIPEDKANEIYKMYREQRDKKQISKNSLTYDDMNKLYDLVNSYFKKIKSKWAKLK